MLAKDLLVRSTLETNKRVDFRTKVARECPKDIPQAKHGPVPLARLKRQYTSTSAIIPPAFSSGIRTKSASWQWMDEKTLVSH
jgi:hypothetical protein